MAPPDQPQAIIILMRQCYVEPLEISQQRGGRTVDPLGRRPQPFGKAPCLQWPKVLATRLRFNLCQRYAIGAGFQKIVEQFARGGPLDRHARYRFGQLAQYLPILQCPFLRLKQRFREFSEIADCNGQQEQAVMLALQRPCRGQDIMRAAAGGVAVHVDRDHQVEAFERRIEPPAIGRRQHRIARDNEQRPDLAFTRRLDFLGQCGSRKFAHHQRMP